MMQMCNDAYILTKEFIQINKGIINESIPETREQDQERDEEQS